MGWDGVLSWRHPWWSLALLLGGPTGAKRLWKLTSSPRWHSLSLRHRCWMRRPRTWLRRNLCLWPAKWLLSRRLLLQRRLRCLRHLRLRNPPTSQRCATWRPKKLSQSLRLRLRPKWLRPRLRHRPPLQNLNQSPLQCGRPAPKRCAPMQASLPSPCAFTRSAKSPRRLVWPFALKHASVMRPKSNERAKTPTDSALYGGDR